MSQPIRFGIMCLQNLAYPTLVERWRQVEALGFDSVWMGDHFVNPFAPAELWFEAWSLPGATGQTVCFTGCTLRFYRALQ